MSRPRLRTSLLTACCIPAVARGAALNLDRRAHRHVLKRRKGSPKTSPPYLQRQPSRGCILRREEVHVPAEGIAHVPGPFEQTQRDDRARGLQLIDTFGADA